MSYILKALQKVENEKAAQAAGGLNNELLRSGREKDRRVLYTLLGMSLVVVLAVLVTFAMMGGFGAAPKTVTQAVSPRTLTTAKPDPGAMLPAQPVKSAPGLNAQPATVAPPAPKIETWQPLPTQAKRESKKLSKAEPLPVRDSGTEQKSLVTDAPSLKVSGIAWQKDGSTSVAVVNGRPVMSGDVVEGCRIAEILPDRVRFSAEGKAFEISIGESKEAGKGEAAPPAGGAK